MRVYLVQHGESLPEEINPHRPLTEKGKEDALTVAHFLKEAKVTIEVIWHSTKLRAKQTAYLMGETLLLSKGMVEKQGLAPNDPVKPIKEEISGSTLENLMIVGHLPFLSKLTSLLLTDSETHPIVNFRQGGVLCLEQNENRNWGMAWMIILELLRKQ